MADINVEVDISEPAFGALLRDVGRALISELADETADTARTIAPVEHRTQPRPAWVKHPHPPGGGELKASVAAVDSGDDHADVVSLWYGRFLDPKARQLHRRYPFLPSALYATVDGRVFYL